MKTFLHNFKAVLLIAAFIGGLVPVAEASWSYVGAPGISPGAAGAIGIAVDTSSGTPYLAFADGNNNSRVCVMKYNGTSWDTVGTGGISSGTVTALALTVDKNGTPYVAYLDVDFNQQVCVKKFDGVNWVTLDGLDTVNSITAIGVSIITDGNGTPYVAYSEQDFSSGTGLNVKKFDGANWVQVGAPNISAFEAQYADVALSSGNVPYVVYQDFANDSKASVKMFDGSDWVLVGPAGFTSDIVDYTTIAIDNSGAAYVGFSDVALGSGASVMKFDGVNWVYLGTPAFSALSASYIELTIDYSGNPYVCYTDEATGFGTTVMKYDGSNWTLVGCPGITGGTAIIGTMAFTKDNMAYVAVMDWNFDFKASVLTYTPSAIAIQSQPADQSGCSDVSFLEFTVSSNNADSYQWQEDAGAGFVDLSETWPYAGTTDSTLTVNFPGLYTLDGFKYRCLLNNSSCDPQDTTDEATIAINPDPDFSQSTSNVLLCGSENTTQLIITSSDTTLTYVWQIFDFNISDYVSLADDANYSGTSNDTLTITNVNTSLSTFYYQCVVYSALGCVTSSPAQFTYITDPNPDITPNATASTVCEGTSVTLFGSDGFGFTWDNGVTDAVAFAPATSYTYTLFGFDVSGCPATDTITVEVTPNPLTIPSIAADGPVTFCQGGSVNLTASNTVPGFVWSSGPVDEETINVNVSGSYSVTNMDGNGCSRTSLPVDVTAVDPPGFTQSNANVMLCGSENVAVFTVTPADTGYTYQWQRFDDNIVDWVNLSDDANYAGTSGPELTVTDVNTNFVTYFYNCIITAPNPLGCATNAQFNLLSDPTPHVTANATATSVCEGSEVTLYGSDGSSFTWNKGVSDFVPFTIDVTDTYTVTGYDNYGCVASDSVTIDVFPNTVAVPVITADGPVAFCEGGSVNLTASNTTTDYMWSNGTMNVASIPVVESGNYTVTNMDGTGCTRTSLPFDVYVPVLPTAMITQKADCEGTSASVSAGVPYRIPIDLDPNDDCTRGTYIDGFEFAGINNQGSGCSAGASTTYAYYPAITASVVQGTKYPFTFTPPAGITNGLSYGIWIDLNNDGDFDEANEMVYSSINSPNDFTDQPFSDSLTIPLLTPSCFTRLRVRTSWILDFGLTDAMRPDNGETEDYMILIGSASPLTYSWTSVPAGFTSTDQYPGAIIGPDTTYSVTVTEISLNCTSTTSVALDTANLITEGAYGNSRWNVYCYNGTSMDTYEGYYVEDSLNFDSQNRWDGNGSPYDYSGYNGCYVNTDGHTVVYKRENFACGLYSIDIAFHDQECSLYIDDILVFQDLGCCDSHNDVWTGVLNSTSKIMFMWADHNSYSAGALNINMLSTEPDLSAISGNDNACLSESGVSYSVDPISGITSYIWSVPSGMNIVSGDSTNSILVDMTDTAQSGTISVYAISDCGSGTPSTLDVTVNSLPDRTITPDGPTTFCSGGSVTLTAPPSLDTYEWSTGSTTDTIIVTAPGNYYALLTGTSGCSVYSDTITVDTLALPVVSVTPLDTVGSCNPAFNLTNGSPSGGSYSGLGVTADQFDPSIGEGTYTITYLYSDVNSCSNSASTDIVVAGSPAVTFDPLTDVGECETAFPLTTGSPAGGVYSGTNVSGGNFNAAAAGEGIHTLTYTVEDVYGCANSTTRDITVTAVPTVISVTSGSRCDAGIVTLTATASAGTLNWYAASSGGSSLGTGTSYVTPSISSTITFYVDATLNGCSSARAAVDATINNTPSIASTTPGSRCEAGTVTLSATASAGTLNWFAASSGGSSLATGTSYTTPSISSTTPYYVAATNNGCTSTRTSVDATVNTTPTVASTTPGSRCDAGTVTLGATASAGALNWYAASSGGSSLATGTSYITPSISSTNTYYVDATNNGCTSVRTGVVATVTATPTIDDLTPGSVCDAGTVTLAATASAGTLNWYAASSGGSSLATGATYTTPSIISSAIYYVEATDNGCTSERAAVDATVNTTPTVASTTPGSRCGNGTVTLGATASAGTLSWYAASSGGSSLGSGTSYTTASISSTTPYFVDASDNGCISTRTSVDATVNISPSVASTTSGSRCDAGTVTLGATASAGTLNWYAASSGGSSLGTGTSYTTPSISASGTYYVDATNNGCTSARTPVDATVTTTPTVSSTTPGSVCDGGIVTLSATASAGTLNWYDVSTGGSSLSASNTLVTPNITSSVTYYVDASDNGCTSTRTAIDATVTTTPVVSSTTPGSRCDAGTVALGATASAGMLSWYAASSGGSILGTGTSFTTPSITSTTPYYVDATDNGCISTRTSVDATVNTTPSVASTTPGSVCDAGTVTLSATASAGTLNWYAASSGGSSLGTGTSYTTPNISSTTPYYVDATDNGCNSARTSVDATVNTTPTVTSTTPGSRCDAGTVVLEATADAGTLNWYAASSGGSSLGIGLSFTTPSISSTTPFFVDATNNGCTSERTSVDATISGPIDVTTSVNLATITANESTGSYEWIDCNNSNAIISGENGQSYTALVNGDYAVIVTVGSCSDTSACVNINVNGIPGIAASNSISIYPNPNNGVFTIKSSGEVVYSLINELEQAIQSGILNSAVNYTVDVRDLPNGIYFVIGRDNNTVTKEKIVVAK